MCADLVLLVELEGAAARGVSLRHAGALAGAGDLAFSDPDLVIVFHTDAVVALESHFSGGAKLVAKMNRDFILEPII